MKTIYTIIGNVPRNIVQVNANKVDENLYEEP